MKILPYKIIFCKPTFFDALFNRRTAYLYKNGNKTRTLKSWDRGYIELLVDILNEEMVCQRKN